MNESQPSDPTFVSIEVLALLALSKEATDLLYQFSNIEALIDYKASYFYRVFQEYLTKSKDSDHKKYKSISRFTRLARRFTKVSTTGKMLVGLRQAHLLFKISKLTLKMAESAVK